MRATIAVSKDEMTEQLLPQVLYLQESMASTLNCHSLQVEGFVFLHRETHDTLVIGQRFDQTLDTFFV